MLLRRAYSIGLVLYPADFRARFGGEMVAVFEQAAAQRRDRGSACVLWFFLREILGLVAGAARERVLHDDVIEPHDDFPMPSDVAGAERSLEIVSGQLIHAIAWHDFANARHYERADRKLRTLLARLRAQLS